MMELTIEEIAVVVRALQKEVSCLELQVKFPDAYSKDIIEQKNDILIHSKSALEKISKVTGCAIPNDVVEDLWNK